MAPSRLPLFGAHPVLNTLAAAERVLETPLKTPLEPPASTVPLLAAEPGLQPAARSSPPNRVADAAPAGAASILAAQDAHFSIEPVDATAAAAETLSFGDPAAWGGPAKETMQHTSSPPPSAAAAAYTPATQQQSRPLLGRQAAEGMLPEAAFNLAAPPPPQPMQDLFQGLAPPGAAAAEGAAAASAVSLPWGSSTGPEAAPVGAFRLSLSELSISQETAASLLFEVRWLLVLYMS